MAACHAWRRSAQSVRVFTVVAVVSSVVGSSFGSGFRNPPADPLGLATDGGRPVWAEGVSALLNNPANIVESGDAKAQAAVNMVIGGVHYRSPMGVRGSTESSVATLPSICASLPLANGRAAAGLGVSVPFGQAAEWEKHLPFPYYSQLAVVDIAPTLAAKLGSRVAVGIGVDLYTSSIESRQVVPWAAFTRNPADLPGRITLSGDGTAAGANAGVTWDIGAGHRAVLTWRSGFDMDYEGETEVGGIPAALTPLVAARSDFETQIRFPAIASAGYGVKVGETVRVAASVEWVDFSRNQRMPLDLGVNNRAGLAPNALRNDWNDTWNYGLAGLWEFSRGLFLRASYKYLESPIPDATYSPVYPDADRHVLAVGAGLRRGVHSLDIAYAVNVLDDRTLRGSANPQFDGEYSYTSQIAGLSYGCAF